MRKLCSLGLLLGSTLGVFLVEVVLGYRIHSLTLISNSCHLLANSVALIAVIAGIKITTTRQPSSKRIQLYGVLLNAAVFAALCFVVFVEAIIRVTKAVHPVVENPFCMLVVGVAGLSVDMVVLVSFVCCYGRQRGRRQQAEQRHRRYAASAGVDWWLRRRWCNISCLRLPHGYGQTPVAEQHQPLDRTDVEKGLTGSVPPSHLQCANLLGEVQHAAETGSCHGDALNHDNTASAHPTPGGGNRTKAADTVNMTSSLTSHDGPDVLASEVSRLDCERRHLSRTGVILHVSRGVLGSLLIIASSLVLLLVDSPWKNRIDSLLSLSLIAAMSFTTAPLVKESALILMQTVSSRVDVNGLEKRLLNKMTGILDLGELHTWRLPGDKVIATVQVQCDNIDDYAHLADDIKKICRDEGVHSTIVQPKFAIKPQLITSDDVAADLKPVPTPSRLQPAILANDDIDITTTTNAAATEAIVIEENETVEQPAIEHHPAVQSAYTDETRPWCEIQQPDKSSSRDESIDASASPTPDVRQSSLLGTSDPGLVWAPPPRRKAPDTGSGRSSFLARALGTRRGRPNNASLDAGGRSKTSGDHDAIRLPVEQPKQTAERQVSDEGFRRCQQVVDATGTSVVGNNKDDPIGVGSGGSVTSINNKTVAKSNRMKNSAATNNGGYSLAMDIRALQKPTPPQRNQHVQPPGPHYTGEVAAKYFRKLELDDEFQVFGYVREGDRLKPLVHRNITGCSRVRDELEACVAQCDGGRGTVAYHRWRGVHGILLHHSSGADDPWGAIDIGEHFAAPVLPLHPNSYD